MKSSKAQSRKSGRAAASPAPTVVEKPTTVYWPYGPFLFDDQYLIFMRPDFAVDSLRAWISDVRPLLMFTYWINYQVSGLQTLSYHAFNVLFHVMVSVLVFFIVRKILEWTQVECVW